MPIVINYKICDLAPECGGIEACPTKAFFWNKKTKRPDVNNKKCVSCGSCAKQCPVNAIFVAKTEKEYQKFLKMVANDPRSEEQLWRERLGCTPGRTAPLAVMVSQKNFAKEITKAKGLVALDVWSMKTIDCRYHSVLWDDLNENKTMVFKKLNADKYPELAQKLKINFFPTLLVFKNGQEIWRKEKYILNSDISAVKRQIKKLFSL